MLSPLSAVILTLALATAAPQAYPAFPSATDFTTVSRWVERQTDIAPRDLLDVRDGFAFAVLPTALAQGPRRLRIEVVETRAWTALGGRSAELVIDLACGPAHVTPLSLDVFTASNRLGEASRGVDPGRLSLSSQTLPILAAALCGPSIQSRPLLRVQALPAPRGAGLAVQSVPRLRPAEPGGRIAVQIGAFSHEGAAVAALWPAMTGRPDLDPRLELAVGKAGPVYRALVTGFITEKDAARFCRDRRQLKQRCIVRGPR